MVNEFSNKQNILTIDSIAYEKIKNKYPDKIFTIDFKKTGCSGYEYVFSINDENYDNSKYIEIDFAEFKLAYKLEDKERLFGTIIKYNKTLFEEGFVLENPNVKSICGCGKSVSF